MTDLVPIRRAILSVSDKTDLIPFARALRSMSVEIISTGGTARVLRDADVEVTAVEHITGFPEMMDGRVKTLHPAIHGALLARRDLPEHVAAMNTHGITPVDLVCINLYPFERTIKQPGVSRDEAIEQIDIGGPAMLRSAAKNHDFITVVTGAAQYDRIINEMRQNDGCTTLETRRDLAAAAFTRTAEYDTAISAWMSSRREEPFPEMLRLSYARHADLRYGENPHQRASVYHNPASAEPSVINGDVLHGQSLSYNNLNDGAAALELVQELHELRPDKKAAAIIKHTNACGTGVADTLADAFDKAYSGSPLAAFGGILAMSAVVDRETADEIADGKKFLEVIIAPGYDPDALVILRERWKNARIIDVRSMQHTGHRKINYKSIPGGMLVQDRDMLLASPDDWIHAAGPAPTDDMLEDAAVLWICAKHLKSNAIAIGSGGCMYGSGMGQVDRVAACQLAIQRSGDRIKHADTPVIAASDAFFPFPDAPELLINAGVACIVQPGGSKHDNQTIDLCDERGVTCMVTNVRHFRH